MSKGRKVMIMIATMLAFALVVGMSACKRRGVGYVEIPKDPTNENVSVEEKEQSHISGIQTVRIKEDEFDEGILAEIDGRTGMEFRLDTKGRYVVTGFDRSKGPYPETGPIDLVIPAVFNGKPVFSMGADAFSGKEGIRSVEISNGIEVIGFGSFRRMEDLISISVPRSVNTIGGAAFAYSDNLEEITYSGKKLDWESIRFEYNGGCDGLRVKCSDGYLERAPIFILNYDCDAYFLAGFYGPIDSLKNVKEYEVPATHYGKPVVKIETYSFPTTMHSIETLRLPATIACIAGYSLTNDSLLKISYLGNKEQWENVILEEGSLHRGVEVHAEKDGYVFKNDLIICRDFDDDGLEDRAVVIGYYKMEGEPANIEVPSKYKGMEVVKIGYEAFRDMASLESVSIPEGVETIRSGILRGCSKAKRIDLPKSLKSLDYGAFIYSSSEFTINYAGTVAEWNAVNKNEVLVSSEIRVICSDGETKLLP